MAAGRGSFVRQDLLPPISNGLLFRDANGMMGLGVGECIPQPWIVDAGGVRRMDDLIGGGVRVFLREDATDFSELSWERLDPSIKIVRVESRTRAPASPMLRNMQTILEKDGVLSNWLRAKSCVAAVVRPDNTVYGTATSSSRLADILDAFSRRVFTKVSANTR